MSFDLPIWIEILLGFGVPIGWGVWQLIDLRRERAKDAAKTAQAEAEAERERAGSAGRPER